MVERESTHSEMKIIRGGGVVVTPSYDDEYDLSLHGLILLNMSAV